MLMMLRLVLFFIFLTPVSSYAQQNPVVLELFNAQACSGGHLADSILEKFLAEANPDLIVLNCHVDDVSDLDKDNLGNNFCITRQEDYAEALDLMGLFTPQILINGRFGMGGEKESLVRSGINMGYSLKSVTPIQAFIRNSVLDVTLPKLKTDDPLDVWLIGYDETVTVNAPEAKSSDQKKTYRHIVRFGKKLMTWDGHYLNTSIALTPDITANRYAVIAQKSDHSFIFAAGQTEVPSGQFLKGRPETP